MGNRFGGKLPSDTAESLLPPWTDAISWPGCQRSRANTAEYLSVGETWWPGITHCAPHAGSGPGLQPLSG